MLNTVIKEAKTKSEEPKELWEAIMTAEIALKENKGDQRSDMAREAAQIMCREDGTPIES